MTAHRLRRIVLGTLNPLTQKDRVNSIFLTAKPDNAFGFTLTK